METTGGDTSPISDEIPFFALTATLTERGATVRGLDAAANVSGPTVRDIDRPVDLEDKGKDPFCPRVEEGIAMGTESLFIEGNDGRVRQRAPRDEEMEVLIQKEMRERALRLEHDVSLAGLPRESRMYAAVRQKYYLVCMAADVVSHVWACAVGAQVIEQ